MKNFTLCLLHTHMYVNVWFHYTLHCVFVIRKSSSTSSVIGYTMNGNGSGMGLGNAPPQGSGSQPPNRPVQGAPATGQRMADNPGQMVLSMLLFSFEHQL